MKRMGRKNREYYRICATDRRSPRDGRVIEELGTYDPHVPETDARCTLDGPRLEYWLSVGAQPSDAVRVLIKKYGPKGTHLKEMETARAKLAMPRIIPEPGEPAFVPTPKPEPGAEAPAAEATAEPVAPEATATETVAEPAAEEPKAE
jgi:small subunit ribosomal protein S16